MRRVITEFSLDVNAPMKEKVIGGKGKKNGEADLENAAFETMLHVASAHCDVQTVEFLLDRGMLFYYLIFPSRLKDIV